MSDEEGEGLAVGRAWLKTRLAVSQRQAEDRVGSCSFPTTLGKLLDPVKIVCKGRGEDLGEERRWSSAQERSHLP